MNIFVGNLSFDATQGDVKKLFEGFGNVASVVIVMSKEKKAPKSRGFGFVDMPDEQPALAAIAALNGKEFMGRVLNVDPARPKPTGIVLPRPIKPRVEAFPRHLKKGPKIEVERVVELKKKRQPGTYKGGRRTHSYMKRRGLAGIQEEVNPTGIGLPIPIKEGPKPRRRGQDNPMRWRKKKDQAKPWQKSPGEHKPWEKAEGEARPWKKAEGNLKPWKKPVGEANPRSKSSERPQKSRFRDRKKQGGYKR